MTLLLLCNYNTTIKAQSIFDSIKVSLKQKPSVFAKVDSRISFIDNSRAKIFGVKVGLNYDDRIHFGLGYNQLFSTAKDFEKNIYYTNELGLNDSATAKLKLLYFSAHTEYTYYENKHWRFSIPLLIGVGETSYNVQLTNKNKTIEKKTLFVYEPSVSVEYKITKWFGLGTGIGFRFMLTDSKQLNEKLSSPTYNFKVLLYYNELIKSVFGKKTREKGTIES